jgi:hypothetical protein
VKVGEWWCFFPPERGVEFNLNPPKRGPNHKSWGAAARRPPAARYRPPPATTTIVIVAMLRQKQKNINGLISRERISATHRSDLIPSSTIN